MTKRFGIGGTADDNGGLQGVTGIDCSIAGQSERGEECLFDMRLQTELLEVDMNRGRFVVLIHTISLELTFSVFMFQVSGFRYELMGTSSSEK